MKNFTSRSLELRFSIAIAEGEFDSDPWSARYFVSFVDPSLFKYSMESSLNLIASLLNDLRDAGILEFEFVSPQSATEVNLDDVERAIRKFASNLKTTLEEKPIGRDSIQVKAPDRETVERRIEAFLQRKSEERQKLTHCVQDGECSRTVPVRCRRIGIEHTRNEVGPSAATKNAPAAPDDRDLEKRVSTVENQLGLGAASTSSLLLRMKSIEDRLLYLESVSPEYQILK